MNTTLNPIVATKMFPVPPKNEAIECPYCSKKPNEIAEYVEAANELEMTSIDYVKSEEGTYCQFTGCFVCTECYVKIGMPTNQKLHGAFPYYRMDVNPLEGQNNEMLVKYRLGEI